MTNCGKHRETVLHLFVECDAVAEIWWEIKTYIKTKYGLDVDVTNKKKVLFNSLIPPKGHIVNFLCLIFKQYVYRQRCLRKPILYNQFILYVNQMENIEKYIALKNDKMNKHSAKWNPCK